MPTVDEFRSARGTAPWLGQPTREHADTLIPGELRRIADRLDAMGYLIDARKLRYAANLLD
jgi:hypothetical protein